MNVYEAIEKRRSYRRFIRPASADQLQRLLRAGSLAASPWNRQGWHVVVVEDAERIRKIAEIKYELNASLGSKTTDKVETIAARQRDAFFNASLVVVYQRFRNEDHEKRFDAGGAWLLMGNILLAAVEEGLATRIVSFWGEAEEKVDRLLGMPAGLKQVSAINIGVPDPQETLPERKIKQTGKWLSTNSF